MPTPPEAISSPQPPGAAGAAIDVSVAQPARRYNYWLGGKDNFAADRASGDQIASIFPTVTLTAYENRAFLKRGVDYLAREHGIRQFLDVGSGIPLSPNVHEVAQGVAPECRVVYADNDPVVMAHNRALLTSHPDGATAYLHADLRDPDAILRSSELRDTLDLAQPVAVLLVAVLHFLPDAAGPYEAVARLVGALPSGSFLLLSHGTHDYVTDEVAAQVTALPTARHGDLRLRTAAEVLRFAEGLEVQPPGLVSVSDWHPELDERSAPRPAAADVSCYALLARVP